MKHTSFIKILLLSLFCTHSHAGLILSKGQSFFFEFQSISQFTGDPDDLYSNPPSEQTNIFAFAEYTLGQDYLDRGESLIFSVFEDSTAEAPIRSDIFLGFGTSGFGYLTDIESNPLRDRQGVFKIEVISGSIELDSFTATTVVDGQLYQQTHAIPEPSSIALLLIGGGAMYLRRKRFPTSHGAYGENDG